MGRHIEQLALFALLMAEEDKMEDDSLGKGSDHTEGDLREKDSALGPEEVTTSETDTSKAVVSHIVTLVDAASEDSFAEIVLDKIAISGKPTLIAFL